MLFEEVEYVWPKLGYPPLVTRSAICEECGFDECHAIGERRGEMDDD